MFNAPAPFIDPAIRDAVRRWNAHHARYQYVQIGETAQHYRGDGVGKVGHAVPVLRRFKLDHGKKYSGKTVQALEAQRGVSRVRPPAPKHQLRITLPWKSAVARVVAFNMATDEKTGKPYFDDVRLLRYGAGRLKRDKRLENALTGEQWLMIFKRLARQMFPKDEGKDWRTIHMPGLLVS